MKFGACGTTVLDLAPDLRLAPDFVGLLRNLQSSRLGVYMHEGGEGEHIVLRELYTGIRKPTLASNAHHGEPGELWLARELPPPHPNLDEHVSLISPYVIENPAETAWLGLAN